MCQKTDAFEAFAETVRVLQLIAENPAAEGASLALEQAQVAVEELRVGLQSWPAAPAALRDTQRTLAELCHQMRGVVPGWRTLTTRLEQAASTIACGQ